MMTTATQKWSINAIPASVLSLWVFLVIANLIDVAATAQAFAMGVAEANPISAWIADRWGVAGLTVHKLIWLAAIVFLLPHIRGWTYVLLGFACAVYAGLLVVHGAYLIVL